jgi:CHAT domain
MRVCVQVGGGFVSLVGGEIDHRRPLVADALIDLGRRYGLARGGSDATALLAIGQALYAWLDGAEGWLAELRPHLRPPFLLEIQAPLEPTRPEWEVLHAPWEVLADKAGFLAEDAQLRYAPARRLGKPATPPDLDDYRLGVAFMAAAPRGAQALDFEAEEAAIMAAAGRDLDLLVEESGDPEELGRRLVKLKPTLPVLHLSCHGHNAWRGKESNQAPQPVLMLEDGASGDQRPTTASDLVEALGAYQPRLVFLSACLTAAAGETAKTASESGKGPAESTAAVANSLAGQLARQAPAVLGWDAQ